MNYIFKTWKYLSAITIMLISLSIIISGCGGGGSSSGGWGGSSGGSSSSPNSGRYVFVANYNDGTVGSINLTNNAYKEISVMPDKAIAVGAGPTGVTVRGDNSQAFVTNRNSNYISVINVLNLANVGTLPTGNQPCGVKFSFLSAFAGIANYADGSVSVYNTLANGITNTIAVGGNPVQIAMTSDNYYIYASNENFNVSAVYLGSDPPALAQNIPNAGNAGIDVDINNGYIYVANSATNNLVRINKTNYADMVTIPVGNSPCGVACHPKQSNIVYVTNRNDNTVSVVDSSNNSVSATIPVGASPYGIVFTPDGTTAFVTNSGSNTVSIINVGSSGVSGTVQVGNNPLGIAVSP